MDIKAAKKSKFRSISVAELKIDTTYQRAENLCVVRNIVDSFNWYAFQVLTVGQRKDGSLYVIEGQQRLAAAKRLRVHNVPCMVIDSEGPAHEANIFRRINVDRTSVGAYDRFVASCTQGDETALCLRATAKECMYEIAKSAGEKNEWRLSCVAAMLKTFSRDVNDGRKLFRLLCDVFHGQNWSSRIWAAFDGLAVVCSRSNVNNASECEYDMYHPVVQAELKALSPEQIRSRLMDAMRDAKKVGEYGVTSGAVIAFDVLTFGMNKRRLNKLLKFVPDIRRNAQV